MKRKLYPRSIAIRIAELERLIVYWQEMGDWTAREQIEIQIAYWKAHRL